MEKESGIEKRKLPIGVEILRYSKSQCILCR